jgi:hypothetical protein
MEVSGQVHASAHYPRKGSRAHYTRGWIGPWAGPKAGEKTKIEPRFIGRSTSSLHRLRYPGCLLQKYVKIIYFLINLSVDPSRVETCRASSMASFIISFLTDGHHNHQQDSPGNDGNRTNKLQIWKRAWPCRRLVTLLHFIVSLNCYYGNYFSSVGRVLLVMWHTAKAVAQYRLVRI